MAHGTTAACSAADGEREAAWAGTRGTSCLAQGGLPEAVERGRRARPMALLARPYVIHAMPCGARPRGCSGGRAWSGAVGVVRRVLSMMDAVLYFVRGWRDRVGRRARAETAPSPRRWCGECNGPHVDRTAESKWARGSASVGNTVDSVRPARRQRVRGSVGEGWRGGL